MNFEYPVAVHFQCLKCGICCGDTKEKSRHILLLAKEAEQISETTSQPTPNFAVKIRDREPYSYEMKKRAKEGMCVFLENNRCTIYSSRPLICRFYPFELQVSQDRKYQFLFTKECPGIMRGRMLSERYFRKMFSLAHAKFKQVSDLNR